VALCWTATGTRRGALWDIIPPTNKTVNWSGMDMLRVVNNQIVEVWAIADNNSVLQQLGVKLKPTTW
jgi:predicted ester cyclase